MSLETLLRAARYVEQQELRAKHHQQQQQQTLQRFKIVSPLPLATGAPPSVASTVAPTIVSPVSFNTILTTTTTPATTINGPIATNGVVVAAAAAAAASQQSLFPIRTHSVLEVVPKTVPTNQPSFTLQPAPAPLPPSLQSHVILTTPVNNNTIGPTTTIHTTTLNGFDERTPIQLDLKRRSHSSGSNSSNTSSTSSTNGNSNNIIRSGTREVHNKLEKNRRAHLKECFEMLKKQLPPQQDEKKTSNLSILHSAFRYVQVLKKKERENEHEMERLAREKIAAQQRLAALKKELGGQWDTVDFNSLFIPSLMSSSESESTTMETATVPSLKEVVDDVKKEETIPPRTTAVQQQQQLSVHLPLPQVGATVGQGLVVGLHKVALVASKSLPVTHIIATPPQLNGKVVPLVNAQYLMVSPSAASHKTLSPRSS